MPRTVSHLVHFFTTAAVNFGTLFWVKCYILCMTVMVCVMSIGFLNRKDGDSQCLHMLMIVVFFVVVVTELLELLYLCKSCHLAMCLERCPSSFPQPFLASKWAFLARNVPLIFLILLYWQI